MTEHNPCDLRNVPGAPRHLRRSSQPSSALSPTATSSPTTVATCEPVDYKHKHAGSVASLGLHKGVAQVYGIKMTGWPAWFMHRTYHMSRIPSFNRKVRVVVDWTLAFFLKREVVALGQLHDPREEFAEASAPPVAARV